MRGPARQRVWDPALRVFHWTLAAAVTTSWILGAYGPDIMTLHFWCGYLIITLFVFRVVWGLVGPAPARFAQFVKGPRETLAYVPRFLSRKPSHLPGHSPVGAIGVLALLTLIAAQVTTGLLADPEDYINTGPLAHLVEPATNRWASSWHERLSYAFLAFVPLHVSVMLWYRWRKGEDLIGPMIHGRKVVETPDD